MLLQPVLAAAAVATVLARAATAASFGVFSSALEVVEFADFHFPAAPKKVPNTSFRVQLGLDAPSLHDELVANVGGDLPEIRTFDESGELLGKYKHHHRHIPQGRFRDVTVKQQSHQLPVYTLFSGRDDGVCIALITTVWADGQKYAWTGGFGRLCDKDW